MRIINCSATEYHDLYSLFNWTNKQQLMIDSIFFATYLFLVNKSIQIQVNNKSIQIQVNNKSIQIQVKNVYKLKK